MSRFTVSSCKRLAVAGGLAAALGATVLTGAGIALAHQEDAAPATSDPRPARATGLPVRWSATSPATHLGDQYTLVVENTGAAAQDVWVHALIMDHGTHTNTTKIDERLTLAPGEERELAAANDYGTANHFSTRLGSETQDLAFTVTIVAADGEETARFTDAAFWVREGPDLFRPNGAALATFLGTTRDEIMAALDEGQSLAEIAADTGTTRDELKTFLADRFEERLQQGIDAGNVTDEQAADWRATFVAAIDDVIDRSREPHQHAVPAEAASTPMS